MTLDQNNSKKGTKEKLIELLDNQLLLVDQYEEPHILIEEGIVRTVIRVESQRLRSWLRVRYFEVYHSSPSKDALEEAVWFVYSKAFSVGKNDPFPLQVRFFHDNERSYVDLKNSQGEIVEISRSGIKVQTQQVPMFRNFKHQKALPKPLTVNVEGFREEHFKKLFELIPVKNENDKLLLISWIVAVLLSKESKPILCFSGPKGSGKSTASSIIKTLLDPSSGSKLYLTSDQDLALCLSQNGVVLLDNNTRFSSRMENLLCQAVTGGCYQKRALYTDHDMPLYEFTGSVIINGINTPSTRPDLLERLLMIELEPISRDERKTEKEIWSEFHKYHDDFLTHFLHLAALVKKLAWEGVEYSKKLPRLADFSKIGQLTTLALGKTVNDFLKAFEQNEKNQEMEILENPLFMIVREFVEIKGIYSGTTSELLETLKTEQPSYFDKKKISDSYLGRFINEHIGTFESLGIEIKREKTRRGRVNHLKYVNNPPPLPAQPSQIDDLALTKLLEVNAGDVGDESDDAFYHNEGMIPDHDLENEEPNED